MSFHRFICWCALCGGWAAAAGWALGRALAHADSAGGTGIRGLFLGLTLGVALGLVDAVWVFSLRQVGRVVPRVAVCALVGGVGGLVGGFVGQALFDWEWLRGLTGASGLGALQTGLQLFAWVLTGLMVGVSIGAYDFLRSWVREEELRGVAWKVVRGVVGGTLGGLLGGLLDWQLTGALGHVFPARPDLWAPSLAGFVALGLCVGLLIGVAQVVLKEAWVRVERGFRAGREVPLTKPVLTVGRAESCDLGLFGDPTVERLHARIYQQDDRYLIADAGTAAGTFVNDRRVGKPVPLRSGDLIRVGAALLRFGERRKR
jgi:hypothetical protein